MKIWDSVYIYAPTSLLVKNIPVFIHSFHDCTFFELFQMSNFFSKFFDDTFFRHFGFFQIFLPSHLPNLFSVDHVTQTSSNTLVGFSWKRSGVAQGRGQGWKVFTEINSKSVVYFDQGLVAAPPNAGQKQWKYQKNTDFYDFQEKNLFFSVQM